MWRSHCLAGRLHSHRSAFTQHPGRGAYERHVSHVKKNNRDRSTWWWPFKAQWYPAAILQCWRPCYHGGKHEHPSLRRRHHMEEFYLEQESLTVVWERIFLHYPHSRATGNLLDRLDPCHCVPWSFSLKLVLDSYKESYPNMACVWCAAILNFFILSGSHPDKNGKVALSTH